MVSEVLEQEAQSSMRGDRATVEGSARCHLRGIEALVLEALGTQSERVRQSALETILLGVNDVLALLEGW